MKITNEIEWRVQIADIETLKCYVLFSFYNPDTQEWNEFSINEWENDLLAFVSFYRKENMDYSVWFNGIGFDCPIIEYVLRNYTDWIDLSNMEIVKKIHQYAQDVIDDKNYGKFLQYKEEHFAIPCIDVYTINGLDNEARRSSLKKIEFQLDWHNVEEMPIPHTTAKITKDEAGLIKSYCRNDILATYELFKLTLGDTTHPLYKGNNQIELRLSIIDEFKLPCLSYSDIKIGDELMKKSYCEARNITTKELPKRGTFRKEIRLKKCIPEYVSFKTPVLQELLAELKSTTLKCNDKKSKWERKFKIGGTTYIQAMGGLHSVNDGEMYIADENNRIKTIDVSSMYPATLINNGYFPLHLGIEVLKVYTVQYNKRLELKPLSKNDKKIKGIVDALKLQLNIFFGKMGSMESWLYDLQALYSVTFTGQFSLLMLIENLELHGFKVVVANTDGVEVIVPIGKEEEFTAVCKEWEKITKYILEEDEYKSIYMSTVNSYIATTVSDKVKTKGDFISDFELHKNKSARIVPLALQEYFTKGVNPEEFIKKHENIYDFCIMARATGQLYLEMERAKTVKNTNKISTEKQLKEKGWTKYYSFWVKEEWIKQESAYDKMTLTFEEALASENKDLEEVLDKIKLKKLVRYYLDSSSEWQLYKRGIGTTGKRANISVHAPNELGKLHFTYFNKYEKKDVYNIDYNQYIYKALKLIDKIEGTRKAEEFINRHTGKSNQLTLF